MLKHITMVLSSIFAILMLSSTVSASPVETFSFKNDVTKVRFQTLTKELRCPKCQNQDLADSNAPIAADLRKQIYTQLNQGKSDQEIVDYMVARYGEFVLYRPRVSSLTYVLWFGPALLLLLGAIIVVIILRSRSNKNEDKALSADEQKKLQQLLNSTETPLKKEQNNQ